MTTTTRKQAGARLQALQAQMFVLGEEAKQLAGFLNGAEAEDQERAYNEQQTKREQEAAALQGQAETQEQEEAEAEPQSKQFAEAAE